MANSHSDIVSSNTITEKCFPWAVSDGFESFGRLHLCTISANKTNNSLLYTVFSPLPPVTTTNGKNRLNVHCKNIPIKNGSRWKRKRNRNKHGDQLNMHAVKSADQFCRPPLVIHKRTWQIFNIFQDNLNSVSCDERTRLNIVTESL